MVEYLKGGVVEDFSNCNSIPLREFCCVRDLKAIMDAFSSFFDSSSRRWNYDTLKNFRQISPAVQNHLKQVRALNPISHSISQSLIHLTEQLFFDSARISLSTLFLGFYYAFNSVLSSITNEMLISRVSRLVIDVLIIMFDSLWKMDVFRF